MGEARNVQDRSLQGARQEYGRGGAEAGAGEEQRERGRGRDDDDDNDDNEDDDDEDHQIKIKSNQIYLPQEKQQCFMKRDSLKQE